MSVQFYGYNFGGTGVFHFFAFMHSFQKLVSDFGDFQTFQTFCLSSLQMLSPALTASPIKDVPDLH